LRRKDLRDALIGAVMLIKGLPERSAYWMTLYELMKLPEETLREKIADRTLPRRWSATRGGRLHIVAHHHTSALLSWSSGSHTPVLATL
jgi:hypothetical protein